MTTFDGAGGGKGFGINSGNQTIVVNFGAFGTDDVNPANAGELDTLVFQGSQMTAQNMILTQAGADTIVTFEGDNATKVVLKNTKVEALESVAGKGNFQFFGQMALMDSVDVWSATQADGTVNPNTVTFLNAKNNNVTGSSQNDVINGQGGNDTLVGSLGADILRGEDGNDLLDGGSGIDILVGGKGNDTYQVDVFNDQTVETLNTKQGGGVDTLVVFSSVAALFALGRNLENLAINQAAQGTSGYGNSLANTMTASVAGTSLYGAGGNDTLKATQAGISLAGNAGNDKLQVLSGTNFLYGGPGTDTLIGGSGIDNFFVDSAKDKIVETAATGTDTVFASTSFSLKSLTKVENLWLDEGGAFSATGNALNNDLRGNASANTLDGAAGADQLYGGAGADILIGGSGDDQMIGGAGNDTYSIDSVGDKVDEQTNADSGDTVILTKADLYDDFVDFTKLAGIENVTYKGNLAWMFTGDNKANILIGGSNNDTLDGLDGDNILDGGKGADTLKGADGDDIYIIDNKNDRVVDSGDPFVSLNDLIRASINIDLNAVDATNTPFYTNIEHVTLTGKAALTAAGNGAANTLTGNAGANMLNGGDGKDILIGDAGNDSLIGAADDDTLYGGAGNDIAVFIDNKANATITYDGSKGALIVTTADGTDTLYGIETLQFLGGSKIAMPAIKDANGAANTVAENAAAGASVGITVSMTGTSVKYYLVDDANGRFTINADTGIVSLAGAGILDYEANATRTIVVQAVDTSIANQHKMSEKNFTIKITDAQEIAGGEKTKEAGLNDIDLAALAPNRGFRFDGLGDFHYAGYSLAVADDINGDGYDDLIIGSPTADSAYIVFGKAGGFGPGDRLDHLDGSNGFRIDSAAAYDRLGASVAGAGDINGDGFGDLIVGAPYTDNFSPMTLSTLDNAGTSYVIFGKAGGFAPVLDAKAIDDGTNGFALRGTSGDGYSGFAVSAAGDVNGDGYDDLAIGAPNTKINGNDKAGISHIVFGKSDWSAGSFDLTGSFNDGTDGIRLDGAAFNDQSGHAIAGVGDLNGDGFDEVLIGAPYADPGGTDVGTGYVLFGGANIAGPVALSSLFSLPGLASLPHSNAGLGVAGIGDINGDGFDELAIGSDGFSGYSGSVFVVFGAANLQSATIDLASLDGSDGFRVDVYDFYGAISAAGDVNGDGYDDFIIGAYYAGYGTIDSGSAYLIYGKSDWSGSNGKIDLTQLTPAQGFRIDGAATGDLVGRSVSGGGDLNGDGFDDLVIGAPYANLNGITDAGSTYVIYGGNFTGQTMKIGTSKDDKLTGTLNADILNGGLGNDILTGKGGADVFQGGAGNDEFHVGDIGFALADGGGGTDTLSLDFAGDIGLAGLGLAHKFGNTANIDIIDMENGFIDNALVLTPEDVIAFGADLRNVNEFDVDSLGGLDNALKIDGDIGDALTLTGTGGWMQSVNLIPGYDFYQAGNAIFILVDRDITVSIV